MITLYKIRDVELPQFDKNKQNKTVPIKKPAATKILTLKD